MFKMPIFEAVATHWAGGWEIQINGRNASGARTLAGVRREAERHIGYLHGIASDAFEVKLTLDMGPFATEVDELAAAKYALAARTRALAYRLGDEGNMAPCDIATVLDIPLETVEQILIDPKES